MQVQITRIGKIFHAEVIETKTDIFGIRETVVDHKEFNEIGQLFGIEPTQKTYDKANK